MNDIPYVHSVPFHSGTTQNGELERRNAQSSPRLIFLFIAEKGELLVIFYDFLWI